MATTFTFEAHPVETKTGQWCETCHAPSASSFGVAFATDDLRLLGTVTASLCATCDRLEVTR